ncbi:MULTISPECIES: ribose/proton symporter RbsU [Lactobacillus]|uniref:ribose/proton symporter RbsU n=1 Tax=Lactobacillus TaxID=1578 RepID=UPI00065F7D8B|nr:MULTISPECIES: GRP family sugar transporter [Lactobacillus]MCQ5245471.1 GRP family sugar transporter [Lactobacillus gasseri]MCZ3508564.1 GRP family sugar transporter [Lactobacillus gasseri]MCZ3739948.1 GRP family sugar transporter [Lactobacillus gasseri]MCZ3743323.1 GRP family sugar transporter [Lactobacillus gasseri]MDX5124001.1 GRP family sugar transporter [Lactobacillus paragasseri]
MQGIALLVGLGPLIGWGLFPTIASKIGGKPVNQIIGATFGTFIFAVIYNLMRGIALPTDSALIWSIISGIGWASAQILTFHSFTLIGSSGTMPITTAFQLLGTSLWGVFALGDWPNTSDKLVGFLALALIVLGAWMTTWTEKKTDENSAKLRKAVIVLLIGEIGYWAYSAAPQAAKIDGSKAFLPQAIGMCLVAIFYAIYLKVKNPKQTIALAQGISYKQIISGFFFAFAALTYLISAQPDMNGLATGFILSQTSVVLATLTGIWFLHESKTKKEMIVTLVGLAIIIGAATMTVIV